MKPVKCVTCGVLLDQGPVLYTDEGLDSCLQCYNTPKEPLVKECASQTNNTCTTNIGIQAVIR